MTTSLQDKYRACLVGLAAGDAVGTTLEFKRPGSFTPIQDMVGGGPFNLRPGQWTDDTSMALCLADSLIACRGFDPADQMQRYVRWWQEGYLSSTGSCFDIGNTTRSALANFRNTNEPFSGPTSPQTAGNGSIMRLAPVVLFYGRHEGTAVQRAAQSSRTTHGATTAVDACRLLAFLILQAFQGELKKYLLQKPWPYAPLAPEIEAVRQGSYLDKNPPEIRGSGYVVDSLEAALWAFHRSKSFEEGCLLAANLGDDADTTAAVYGQLAGAYYGLENIPAGWREKLTLYDQIVAMADQLYQLSQEIKFA